MDYSIRHGNSSGFDFSIENVIFSLACISTALVFTSAIVEIDLIPNWPITSKVHAFNTLSAVGLVFCLTFIVLYVHEIRIDRIDICLISYALYQCINYYVRELPYSEYLTSNLLCIFLFLCFKQTIFNHPRRNAIVMLFFCFILLIGLAELVYGELQLMGIKRSNHVLYPITGSMHNPGPFGIYLSTLYSASVGFILFNQSESEKRGMLHHIALLVIVLSIIILPSTDSRSAWLAAIISTTVMFCIRYKSQIILITRTHSFKTTSAAILIIIVVIFATLKMINYKIDSVYGRFYVWQVSAESIKNNIVTGHGFDQFRYQYGRYLQSFHKNNAGSYAETSNSDYVDYAFNDYLQILIENGIIGLALFLTIVMIVLKPLFKLSTEPSDNAYYPVVSAVIAVLVASFTSYALEMITIFSIFIFCVIISSLQLERRRVLKIGAGSKSAIGVLSVFALSALLLNEHSQVSAKLLWKRADDMLTIQSFDEASRLYGQVAEKRLASPDYLLGYGKALYMTGEYERAISILENASKHIADPFMYCTLGDAHAKLKSYQKSQEAYTRSILVTPNRLYPRYLLVKMLLEKGDTLEARVQAKNITDLRVFAPSQASSQILKEMEALLTKQRD